VLGDEHEQIGELSAHLVVRSDDRVFVLDGGGNIAIVHR